jgi:heterodisulfide reductase subunit A
MAAIKNARCIKEKIPDVNIYILNRDIRTVGKAYEEYYQKARAQGIKFVKYDPEKPAEVTGNGDRLRVKVYNETLGKQITINSDLVVLSTPLVPPEDNKKLSQSLKVPLDQNGFLLEAHVKLRPVDFATDGVYLCGTAHSPKDIVDSISQALGAASRATIPLTLGTITTEGATSWVNEELCIGCGRCIDTCTFDAISLEKNEKGEDKARINDAICKGCGSCASVCPNSAIIPRHFERAQILAMIDELLEA